jgi:hypothetical protein
MAVALDVAVVDDDDSGEVRRLTAPVPPPVLDDVSDEDDDDELINDGNTTTTAVSFVLFHGNELVLKANDYLWETQLMISTNDVPQRDAGPELRSQASPGHTGKRLYVRLGCCASLFAPSAASVTACRPSNSAFLRKRSTGTNA